jgi:peptidoglycan/LPS O-acetylase OafA/YrhL
VSIICSTYFQIDGLLGNLLNPLQIILLGCLVVSAAFTMTKLSGKVLHGNDISYGIYIYHGLILNIFLTLNFVGLKGVISALFLTSILAAFSWVSVEKPMLVYRRYSSLR